MNKRISKAVAFLLCLCMVLSMVPMISAPASAAAIDYVEREDTYYNVISKDDYQLAPGIVESEIVLNNDEGTRRQVAHVVEIDINNPYTKVMPSFKGMHQGLDNKNYGVQIMTEQAAYAEANGYGNVVAAMNLSLSWYNSTYYSQHPELVGEPLGYLIMDGKLYVNSNGQTSGAQTCLVINFDEKDGVARPSDVPKTEIRSTSSPITGWEEQVIPANFGFLVKDGKNQYTKNHTSDSASRSFVGIKADGSIVMVMNDGRQSPFSEGFNSYEMAEFMLSLGCVQAVNGDGGGSSAFLSQRPGEELKLNCSPSDGAQRPTTHGILVISTAPATGEFVRAQISAGSDYYTPGAAVQFTAIGTDLVGTPAEIPADVEWKLTDDSFGTIDNTGMFTSNGKQGTVTAQMIWNGEVVGEGSVTIVMPEISFKQDTLVLPYGENAVLSLNVTTNEGRNTVATEADDIVFTLSDPAMGTINGNVFTTTSDTAVKGGTLTAVICGDTANAITATVKFGKASEIVYDYEDGELLIDVEPEVDPAEGEPYGWFIRDSRANQYFGYRWFTAGKNTPIGADIPSKVYLVDSTTGKVKNGNYAMGVDIDWTNVTASCHGQMQIFPTEAVDLTDATRVGLWMYVPAELVTDSMQIRAGFLKKDGGSTSANAKITDMLGTNSGVDNGGWFYFNWQVLDTYATFEYLEINSHYTAGEGNYNYYQNVTFFIDDITVDYSDATIDRENPYFTSMSAGEFDETTELKGQTFNSNTITLKAQAYENTTKLNATGLDLNSVKVYVDGVLRNENVTVSAGGTINVPDLYLNDGVHTIVIEISDLQGNVGNIVRKVTIKTDKSDVRLEVPAANGLLPTGSLYWLNIVADDLTAIQSVTTTINLDYVNSWELEGMEVAYGFAAEYYVNSHNDAVLTFTRTGTEVADTTVLAKLPVRIWMAKGWMDDSGIRKNYISDNPSMQDKYYILTPHAMWYSDGTRDYRLVVGAEAGVITFADGTTKTFSANETVIQTEMNRYYTNSDRQGKWSFHICKPGAAQSKAPTCTEAGYENRVFCTGCSCGTVENTGKECDNHNGCGSVIDWGTIIPATGHSFDTSVDGLHKCDTCKGTYCYIDGQAQTGWIELDGNVYYCGKDGKAYSGRKTIDGITYMFIGYKLDAPALVSDGVGLTGWWAGKMLDGGWHTLNGRDYFVTGIYVNTGVSKVALSTSLGYRFYAFDSNGMWLKTLNGLYNDGTTIIYAENGVAVYAGLVQDGEGNYYYINSTCKAVTDRKYGISEANTNGLLPAGTYEFGPDGKMINPPVEEPEAPAAKNGLFFDEDGEIRFYVNDVPTYAGIVADAEGNLYYINSKKTAVKSCKYGVSAARTNGLIEAGVYEFDATGKLILPEEEPALKNGLSFDEDGEVRFYVDGVATYAGIVADAEGNLYYINSKKTAVKNCKYGVSAARTNGLIEAGIYEFDATGKMVLPEEEEEPVVKNGLSFDEDGEIRFYVDGVATYAGVVADAEGNLYYINSKKTAVKNCKYGVNAAHTNGLVEAGIYEFDANGKMILN